MGCNSSVSSVVISKVRMHDRIVEIRQQRRGIRMGRRNAQTRGANDTSSTNFIKRIQDIILHVKGDAG